MIQIKKMSIIAAFTFSLIILASCATTKTPEQVDRTRLHTVNIISKFIDWKIYSYASIDGSPYKEFDISPSLIFTKDTVTSKTLSIKIRY